MFRLCAILLWLASPALAEFSGPIRVIDGDTIDVGEIRVRLHGIDAPENNQTCETPRGGDWACGRWVTQQVRARYDGRMALCQQQDIDRYGRTVAVCHVDGQDIGEDLVLDGLAVAYRRYSMAYDLAEKATSVRGVGLWGSVMQNPAAFRADQQAPETAAPDAGCNIKGNISSNGRIYHLPQNRHYAETRIDTSRGERWFCSEAEGRAAGWRAARN